MQAAAGEIGDRLRWLGEIEAGREQHRVAVSALCREADVAREHYHRMLKGERGPNHPVLIRLADALDRLSRQATSEPQIGPTPAKVLASGQEYGVIADGLRARRNELKLTVEEVDSLAGFTQGHTSKLENWSTPGYGRGFGEDTLRLWCQALGATIMVVESPPAHQTLRFINRISPQTMQRRVSAGGKVAREIAAKRERA